MRISTVIKSVLAVTAVTPLLDERSLVGAKTPEDIERTKHFFKGMGPNW